MAAINDLVNQIENADLRMRIQQEVDKLATQKKFGLVFEEHLPECTPLYDIPVKRGSSVALKAGKISDIYIVSSLRDGVASCINKNTHAQAEFPVHELVCVAEFGEAIYPYLKPIDSICNAPHSNLWHTLIEADNYHALQLLEYLYAGKVDCIYIDPPYNTGAKDWKYNNDYVDDSDAYRHSKWLSFIQKRLKIAKKLLNPEEAVLIVTIDEKEYLHLGCLLEEMFPEANIQMITSVISGKGVSLVGQFSRVEEYIFIVTLGKMVVTQQHCNMLNSVEENEKDDEVEVEFIGLRRRNTSNFRTSRPNQFYPFFVNQDDGHIVAIGDAVSAGIDRNTIAVPKGCVAIWPLDPEGRERIWGLVPESSRQLHDLGCIKVGGWNKTKKTGTVKYWASGNVNKLKMGEIKVKERDEYGVIVKAVYAKTEDLTIRPRKVWNMQTHNASTYGTLLLRNILIEKRFSFPKSLYAVTDTLRFFVSDKPNAIILDFFAGSGTTLHAVNMLNAEDCGNRRCIMVTNNEVSELEASNLLEKGIKPGDSEWEKIGIARYVTWPRTVYSIQGTDVSGNPLEGEYFTSLTTTKEIDRKFAHINFIKKPEELTKAQKKKIVSIVAEGNLPQNLVKDDTKFIISKDDKHTVSILFDDTTEDEWLEALEGAEHIQKLVIITASTQKFNSIKKQATEVLGRIKVQDPIKIPMADGFKANAAYFKLGFLDKNSVALGRQFRELLSILWMKAGCVGACPTLPNDKELPDMLVLPENSFAVLIDETKFSVFEQQVNSCPEIKTVFIITDSGSGYRDMIANLKADNTYQLYRDYLDNFRINIGR